MGRFPQLAAFVMWFLIAGNAFGATHYVDWLNGNDANNGTSKTTPWKRHPFMQGFAGAYTHQPGDQFIFKGGVTWPNSCFVLLITVGGTAGNIDYYGVDQTWFSGASWTQPIFDLQQLHTPVGTNAIKIQNGASYITIDNLELKNLLIDAPDMTSYSLIWVDTSLGGTPTNIDIKNCYVHGWFRGPQLVTDNDGGGIVFVPSVGYGANDIVENCVIENAAAGGNIGELIRGPGIARNNIVHDARLGIVAQIVANNTIYNIPDSFDPTAHPDGIYMFGSGLVYNNLLYNNTQHGVIFYLDPSWTPGGGTLYAYNNVIYANPNRAAVYFDTERAVNSDVNTIYFYNNTVETPLDLALINAVRSGGPGLTKAVIQNIHYIIDNPGGPGGNPACYNYPLRSCGVITNITDVNNVVMSHAMATAQGYTFANQYAPTSVTNSTVGVGANLSSVCSGNVTAICKDIKSTPRPSSGAWNVGAYEFRPSSAPNPPTNLSAVVH